MLPLDILGLMGRRVERMERRTRRRKRNIPETTGSFALARDWLKVGARLSLGSAPIYLWLFSIIGFCYLQNCVILKSFNGSTENKQKCIIGNGTTPPSFVSAPPSFLITSPCLAKRCTVATYGWIWQYPTICAHVLFLVIFLFNFCGFAFGFD